MFIVHPTTSYACFPCGPGINGDSRRHEEEHGLLYSNQTETQQGQDLCPESTLQMPREREGTGRSQGDPRLSGALLAGAQDGGRRQSGKQQRKGHGGASCQVWPLPLPHFALAVQVPSTPWKPQPAHLLLEGSDQSGGMRSNQPSSDTAPHAPLCSPGLPGCTLKYSSLLRAALSYDCRERSGSSTPVVLGVHPSPLINIPGRTRASAPGPQENVNPQTKGKGKPKTPLTSHRKTVLDDCPRGRTSWPAGI